MERAEGTGIVAIAAGNVRRAHKAAGMSQQALAHQAALDRTYVSQVERGRRNLTVRAPVRLAAALGTTPDRLLRPERGEPARLRHSMMLRRSANGPQMGGTAAGLCG